MMDRRRALMMAQEETGQPLENLTPGTGIWISESGTLKQWIYLGKDSSGNCQMLRERAYGQRRISASSMSIPNYDGTEMDTYLSGTYLNKFTAKVKGYLTATTISHRVFNSSTSSSSYPDMIKKCYLPTMKQMGYGGSEAGTVFLQALRTFYSTTSDNAARKAMNESGTTVQYWLSSAYTQENRFHVIGTTANLTYNQATNGTAVYYRPILSFSAATPVKNTDDGYVIG